MNGFYLFIDEEADTTALATAKSHSYGFHANLPFAFIPLGNQAADRMYEIGNLPDKGRYGGPLYYRFGIAVVDTQGRVGVVSPLSAQIVPDPIIVAGITQPVGLQTTIWTVNDRSIANGGSGAPGGVFGTPNPRTYEGIKLQWAKTGNRVYRSEHASGPFCLIVREGPANPPPEEQAICADTTALSETVTSDVRFFLDLNVEAGRAYYYKVSNSANGVESTFSEVVAGMVLPRPTQPLSPPRHFKAWAALDAVEDGNPYPGHKARIARPGVYLRWCPNWPADEVTGYRIYRSYTKGGPYTRLAEIDNAQDTLTTANNCLTGSLRCQIEQACSAQSCPNVNKVAACTSGVGGTCKLVDLTITQYPSQNASVAVQAQAIYYYVVTALRGSDESAYSEENSAWPHYLLPNGTYGERYEPDRRGDFACDDEMSDNRNTPILDGDELMWNDLAQSEVGRSLSVNSSMLDEVGAYAEGGSTLAPYLSIGSFIGNTTGGVGGQGAPAVVRWIFTHVDHLGSPRVVFDATGGIVSTHHFMPFGDEKPIAARASSNTRYFTGHERDQQTATPENPDGLDYMLARYYSSSLGRFMAVDPGGDTALEDPQSWNKYAYVRNNPLGFTDPDGRCSAPSVSGGTVGICAEAFISSSWIPPTLTSLMPGGRGDNRSFSASDATLTSRVQTQIVVDPASGRISSETSAGRSVFVGEPLALNGAGQTEITNQFMGVDGTISFTASISGQNGFSAAGVPTGLDPINMSFNFVVARNGDIGMSPGGAVDGYPSVGAYGYREGEAPITLFEHPEGSPSALRPPMEVQVPSREPQ